MTKRKGEFFAPMERTTAAELEVKFPLERSRKAALLSLRTAVGLMQAKGFSDHEIRRDVDGILKDLAGVGKRSKDNGTS